MGDGQSRDPKYEFFIYVDRPYASLLPPSCMVAPNRELVNTPSPFDTSIFSSPMVQNNMNMNIDVDTLRVGPSILVLTALENCWHIQVSSIPYVERMEAQNNNLSCADQVEEFNELQELTLSYID